MTERELGDYVSSEDYDTLRTANQRLEGERDAILLQARCWAGEAKAQQSITREVGEILGGVADWGPIADSVAAIVADRQRLEGENKRLREALETVSQMCRKEYTNRAIKQEADAALRDTGEQP
jgi:hypothetical protein